MKKIILIISLFTSFSFSDSHYIAGCACTYQTRVWIVYNKTEPTLAGVSLALQHEGTFLSFCSANSQVGVVTRKGYGELDVNNNYSNYFSNTTSYNCGVCGGATPYFNEETNLCQETEPPPPPPVCDAPQYYDSNLSKCCGEGSDDIDCDGKSNDDDDDIDGDGTPNDEDDDMDGDGTPNAQDDDMDGDGTPNDEDDTPSGGGGGSSNPEDPNYDECTSADKNSHTGNSGICVCNVNYELDNFGNCISSTVPENPEGCNYPSIYQDFPYRGLASAEQCANDISFYAYGNGAFTKIDSCAFGGCYWKLGESPPDDNGTTPPPDGNGTTPPPDNNNTLPDNNSTDPTLGALDKINESVKNNTLSLGGKLDILNDLAVSNTETLESKLEQLNQQGIANTGGD